MKEPQTYAGMFQAAMSELKRQTDLYFEFKKKEFDKYVEETHAKNSKEDDKGRLIKFVEG